ncbi:hypothetical protein A4S06_08385 [Erysipelotrichaceae bacterium MTC7]|nr:hypothetical protein A4S06_08385 [Erysipelotrichaceae bacterium MTC7]
MHYKIKECKIYGKRNPFLFLSGWAESNAKYVYIQDKKQVYYKMELLSNGCSSVSFSLRTPLAKNKMMHTYNVVCEDAQGNKETIYIIKYNVLKQLKNQDDTIIHTSNLRDVLAYQKWIETNEHRDAYSNLTYQPVFSLIIPVYNVERKYLVACLDSIRNQSYQNFEVCIADDASTNQETLQTLKEYEAKDARIHICYRKENGHISNASNSALAMVQGEFVAMMDNDDVLRPNALYEMAYALNQDQELDFIYSDEDKLDMSENRFDPQFKPDYAADKFYGSNYLCHFNVVRTSLMKEIGGFRVGYEGAQDYDLFLRIIEKTNRIYHIPKVLYHWRMLPGSTSTSATSKNYAAIAGKKALVSYFENKQTTVQVDIVLDTHYFVKYVVQGDDAIEILVDAKNFSAEDMNRLVATCKEQSYKKVSIIAFVKKNQSFANVICIPIKDSFVSTVNAYCIESTASHFVFVNEPITFSNFDALELMLGYSQQEEIGVVGGKVLYQNEVIGSSYALIDEKLLFLHPKANETDYGVYSTLLIPSNARVLEDSCFMISKKIVNQIKLDGNLVRADVFFDLHLQIYANRYRNVLLPAVEIETNTSSIVEAIDKRSLDKWIKMEINTDEDPFYSPNLSKVKAYTFRD